MAKVRVGQHTNLVFKPKYHSSAVSYIGLTEDEIADRWKGGLTHERFDGQREWAGAVPDVWECSRSWSAWPGRAQRRAWR